MKWIKIKIDYFSDNLEITKNKLISLLSEIGIDQIEVVDYFSENKLDYDLHKYQNSVWSIIGYIIDNRFTNAKLNILIESLNLYQGENQELMYEIYTSGCSENDWKDEWKKYFKTTKITDKITVKPSWQEYEKEEEDEIVIEIDPGMAFGTGTHETTSLCVELLEKYSAGKENLLDIGCGSGILMLIGKKMGINNVDGIDIDPNVKNVVIENMQRNHINENYNVIIGNLVDDVDEKYDIIVSNILVDVLTQLLDSIETVLKDGAIIIFSGILKEKSEDFIKMAETHSFIEIERKEKNKWSAVAFKYEKDK